MRPISIGWIILTLLPLLVTAGCAGEMKVTEAEDLSSYSDEPYRRVLAGVVRDGRVDYRLLREDYADELDVYLDAVARFGPKSTPERFPTRDAELAYYLNAYNAMMLDRWLAAGAGQGSDVRTVNILWFVTDRWEMDGERITMDNLEQRIIRDDYDDPRVHFALVSGARSCPPLLDEPFDGERLNEQLNTLGRRWLNEPDGLRVEPNGEVYMSRIFDWYREDFESIGGLVGVLERYLAEDDPRRSAALEAARNGEIRFMKYNWTINTPG